MGRFILYASMTFILSFKRDSCPNLFLLTRKSEKIRHGTLSHRTYICHGTLLFSSPSCVSIKKTTIISKLHQYNSCPDNNLKHHNSK
jgi:hypothetical protein